MSNAIAVQNGHESIDIAVVEKVITGGDLGQLTPEQRVRYYIQTCESLKLNWRTKPFDVVALRGQGAKTLYPNKGCAEQLAQIHNISVDLLEATTEQGVRIQKAKACLTNGRCATKTGAVPVDGLRGDAYANAVMKCETKAHRRAVLALVGLNMPDESELESIPGSQRFTMDVESGEIAPQGKRPEPSPRPATAPTARPAAPPVTAEVVDGETGEIVDRGYDPSGATQAELKGEIQRWMGELGWTPDNVSAHAKAKGFNLRSREGNIALAVSLHDLLWSEYEAKLDVGDEDDDPEQGTLIDAETRSIERNVTWD